MAASMETNVQLVTTCTLCKMPFKDGDPQLLPCEHTFCKMCVEYRRRNGYIMCATCGKNHEENKVKPNHQLVICIKALEEQANAFVRAGDENEHDATAEIDDNNCQICSQRPLTGYCYDCDKWLCLYCKSKHREVGPWTTHIIVSVKTIHVHKMMYFQKQITKLTEANAHLREKLDELSKHSSAKSDGLAKKIQESQNATEKQFIDLSGRIAQIQGLQRDTEKQLK